MIKQRTSFWRNLNRNGRTSLFRVGTLLVVIISILTYVSNEYQQGKIMASYCGDFGFYSKSLTLMKDNTFKFNYHGCSQTNGYMSGTWTVDGDIITLEPAQPDNFLDSRYRKANDKLLPFNLADDDGFVSCKDYDEPLLHVTIE